MYSYTIHTYANYLLKIFNIHIFRIFITISLIFLVYEF